MVSHSKTSAVIVKLCWVMLREWIFIKHLEESATYQNLHPPSNSTSFKSQPGWAFRCRCEFYSTVLWHKTSFFFLPLFSVVRGGTGRASRRSCLLNNSLGSYCKNQKQDDVILLPETHLWCPHHLQGMVQPPSQDLELFTILCPAHLSPHPGSQFHFSHIKRGSSLPSPPHHIVPLFSNFVAFFFF